VLLARAAFDAFGSYALPIAASAAFAVVATVLVILTPVFLSKIMCAGRIDHLKAHREAEQL
jgi:hypothetical protein